MGCDARPGYRRRMRDGAPLPGLTPAQVVSQLAHRVFGPLQPARTRIVLDYHGLLEHPAAELVEIAGRHRVTTRTVSNNVAAVRAAGARQPLSPALITAATRPSTPGEDHLGRVRIATTLGLPAPAAAAARSGGPGPAGASGGRPGRGAGARRDRPADPAGAGGRGDPVPSLPAPGTRCPTTTSPPRSPRSGAPRPGRPVAPTGRCGPVRAVPGDRHPGRRPGADPATDDRHPASPPATAAAPRPGG